MFIDPMVGFSQVSEKKDDFFKVKAPEQEKGNAFRDIFMSAINDVKTTEDELAKAELELSKLKKAYEVERRCRQQKK